MIGAGATNRVLKKSSMTFFNRLLKPAAAKALY
jgi:hypothetical protein